MVSIGQGADAAVQQIKSLGTNLLMIVPGATTAAGVRSEVGRRLDADRGRRAGDPEGMSAVAEVTYFRRQVVQVAYGNQNWSTVVQGRDAVVLPRPRMGARARRGVHPARRGDRRATPCSATRSPRCSSAPDRTRSERSSASRAFPSASPVFSSRKGRRSGGRTRDDVILILLDGRTARHRRGDPRHRRPDPRQRRRRQPPAGGRRPDHLAAPPPPSHPARPGGRLHRAQPERHGAGVAGASQ